MACTALLIASLACSSIALPPGVPATAAIIPPPPSPEGTHAPLSTVTPAHRATSTIVPTEAQGTLPASANPTLAATAIAQDEPFDSSWPLVLADEFDTNAHGWPEGAGTGELTTNHRRFSNGKYVWDVSARRGGLALALPEAEAVFDLYATVETRVVSGDPGGEYGLMLRGDGQQNYYLFSVNEDGQYAFRLRRDGQWRRLIDWTVSDMIRPGEVNRLAVLAEGSHFVFFINDQRVAEADDDFLRSGQTGLAAQMREGGRAVFEYDNFALRQMWPVVLAEGFDSDEHGWQTGADISDAGTVLQSIEAGIYRWEAAADPGGQGVAGYGQPDAPEPGDFYAAVDVRQASGPPTADYGLYFRYIDRPEEKFYSFAAGEDGHYRLDLYADGEWISLLYATTRAMRPGEINRLAIRAEGAHFSLFINDHQVAQANDDGSASGAVGLGANVYYPGEQAVFEFDNFELRAP